jgi:hypothetical protein
MIQKLKKFTSAFWKISALSVVVIFIIITAVNKYNKINRGTVLGDSAGKYLASEDYQIKQLSIGDSIIMDLNSESQSLPMAISEIKSGIYSVKGKDITSMVLGWQTNKAGICDAAYYKKGETASKNSKESDFILNHTLVLSKLDADSVYAYKIRCLDHWGQEKISDEYVFYTGAANISFMDILGNAAGKLFGWAIKK